MQNCPCSILQLTVAVVQSSYQKVFPCRDAFFHNTFKTTFRQNCKDFKQRCGLASLPVTLRTAEWLANRTAVKFSATRVCPQGVHLSSWMTLTEN